MRERVYRTEFEELALETKTEVDSGTIGFEVKNMLKNFDLFKKNQVVQYKIDKND